MKKVIFKVNGLLKQVVADSNLRLIDLLRDDLGLIGTKQSCDRRGQCGACTVIVNGRAVRSCLTKVVNLDGAEVITVEGLGTPDNPHLIQEAFVLAGAVQCGYCTPGMIMSSKALLAKNPNPTTEEIKHSLAGNLCRCTGYVKIIDAVKLAGRFIRGETTPAEVRPDPAGPKLGVSHPRPTGLLKACGAAHFSSDIRMPGSAEAAGVRSPHAHAIIRKIDYSAAEKMPGVFGVLTAKDINGTNRIKLFRDDRPVLCENKVYSIGDPVAAVVAETREQALAAAKAVVVDYDLLPVLSSPEEAMAPGAIQIHSESPNVCHTLHRNKGDVEKALSESAAVVESDFSTQLNHQAALEPEASVAYLEGDGDDAQLVVIGRSINIHAHLKNIQEALGWENARYEEAFTGGQFGIKLEITTECITAAAALKFRRPVRYIPSLAESMAMTSKRHPLHTHIKIGAYADGRLSGMIEEGIVDNGAYVSNAPFVMHRMILMAASSYWLPNYKSKFKLVYTNNPYGGAARGAGPPQQHFGNESAIDMLAEKLGIDPLEFRLRNSLKIGQTRTVGRPVTEWPFPAICEALRPHYERALLESQKNRDGVTRRGVGVAAGSFGIAHMKDIGLVAVDLNPDGGVTISAAIADPGEGNDSMVTQLAADVMGIPLDKVRLCLRSTDKTTETGAAAGSKMTTVAGGAMVNALEQLKRAMAETGAKTYNQLKEAGYPTRYMGKRVGSDPTPADPVTGDGPNSDAVVHNIQMVELEVDTKTGNVQVLKVTAVVDAGTIINPQNLEGQIEGGIDQGVGFALREQFIPGKTKDWITFKFPTMRTSFDVEVITRETPRPLGTRGAIGIGEMTMVPTAAAVTNAIYNACGVRICHLPATRDKIKAGLAASNK